MLLRIILLPVFLLGDGFVVAMAHYKSIRKCFKYWIIDGCKAVKLK